MNTSSGPLSPSMLAGRVTTSHSKASGDSLPCFLPEELSGFTLADVFLNALFLKLQTRDSRTCRHAQSGRAPPSKVSNPGTVESQWQLTGARLLIPGGAVTDKGGGKARMSLPKSGFEQRHQYELMSEMQLRKHKLICNYTCTYRKITICTDISQCHLLT